MKRNDHLFQFTGKQISDAAKEAATYGTQGERTYELHPDDVIYFRLAGGAREA